MENYVGMVLGNRYEVKDIVGVGGMAVVYKAYDNIDMKVVAVKVLKEEYLSNDEFRRRFKDESKAIAILSHPNIVKVLDVNFGEKLQYIVMEYIEGITLKEYIERLKVVPWKEALHFATQILRALQHAHDKGIVHRDIKPQNIMVLQNGNIKVADFGIARFSRGEAKTITENGAIGSVHYISPEQARGEVTDAQTDIYSVGVVLYEMLTGELPFQSDSAVSVALMQVQSEPKRPRELNLKIPIGLEQITMRAMQKRKRDRYQSASEMLLDLDEFKRNPSIKFDYSFVTGGERSTVYVPSNKTSTVLSQGGSVQRPPKPIRSVTPVRTVAEPVDFDDGVVTEKSRNITIPILIGVLVALVIGVAVLGINIYRNMNKDLTVPSFLGKDYEAVIEEYADEFRFENPPAEVYDENYEIGQVCKQSIAAGQKISADQVILLTICANVRTETVLDVVGKQSSAAEAILRSKGFRVEFTSVYNTTMEEGTVINMNPVANSIAAYNSVIMLYISTKTPTGELVEVPRVIDIIQADAVSSLEALGLVAKVTEGPSEADKKGFVISQSVPEKSKIAKGTTVEIIIGSGLPEEVSVTFPVKLPTAPGTNEQIMCYLNSVVAASDSVLLDGSDYSVTLKGSGASNTFKIYIDATLIYEGTVDFTTDPASYIITGTYDYSNKKSIPDVEGETLDKAKATLAASGFTVVKVITQESDEYEPNIVISQNPTHNSSRQYDLSQEITLVISKVPAATIPVPTSDGPTVNDDDNEDRDS